MVSDILGLLAVRSDLLGEQHKIACYAYLGPFRAARPWSTQHGSRFGSSGVNIEATRWSARSTKAATNSLQADQGVINKPMSWESVCGLMAPQCLDSLASRQREQPSLRGGPYAVPSRLCALHSIGTHVATCQLDVAIVSYSKEGQLFVISQPPTTCQPVGPKSVGYV